jgi:thiamine-phosphate pyrophosphorylase
MKTKSSALSKLDRLTQEPRLVRENETNKGLKRARLYCISQPPLPGQSYPKMVESACKGGADVIQFREKHLAPNQRLGVAKELKEICHRYGVLFIINDFLDIALAVGADGVHLGQEDLPVSEARTLVDRFFGKKHSFLIGCSTHSLPQALRAQEAGADYVGCGPIFSTPTKPGSLAVGLGLIQEYQAHLKIPFVAIGGIDAKNLSQVIQSGAKGVAVVRAAFDQSDVESSVRSLKRLLS